MIERCVYGICRAISLRYAGAMKMMVISVCVTKDGKIVSGSDDKTVRSMGYAGQSACRMQGP